MATAAEPTRTSWHGVKMTAEQFLALPDDGVHRELVRGKVIEEREGCDEGKTASTVTVRTRIHGRIVMRVGHLLTNWLDLQPEPRGEVVGGEAGFLLDGTRESLVGIDVALVWAQLVASTDAGQTFFQGAPLLAIEILSPSDTHADTAE